jgi:hypothetical protein
MPFEEKRRFADISTWLGVQIPPRPRDSTWVSPNGTHFQIRNRRQRATFLGNVGVACGMNFDVWFSPIWYVLFFAFLLAWLGLAVLRRKHIKKKEVKEQFILGLLGSCALLSMEIFATSANLWNYVPRNWPAILWPTYFVAILFGYQLLRVVEKFFQ